MNILTEVNAVLKHKYHDPEYKRAMTQPSLVPRPSHRTRKKGCQFF